VQVGDQFTPRNITKPFFYFPTMITNLRDAAIVTFLFQTLGFVISNFLQTEIPYDICGGINFLVLAILGFMQRIDSVTFEFLGIIPTIFTGLFVISRGWLLIFLAWRAHHRKGDARFQNVVGNPLLFWIYWMVQGCWVYIVSLPLLLTLLDDSTKFHSNEPMSVGSIICLSGFFMGIALEIVSDVQKTLWIFQGRPGGFCRVGLWEYSRHPNYAGEILQWWCAAALCPSWIGFASPFFTMLILLIANGTGISDAEGKNLKRYYESKFCQEYERYRLETSPLIPLIGYSSIPRPIQRYMLFEWERYEYHPSIENRKLHTKKET
jgi:steroid 5-alpha reductase family enzyme